MYSQKVSFTFVEGFQGSLDSNVTSFGLTSALLSAATVGDLSCEWSSLVTVRSKPKDASVLELDSGMRGPIFFSANN
jgi:hypothetical protein